MPEPPPRPGAPAGIGAVPAGFTAAVAGRSGGARRVMVTLPGGPSPVMPRPTEAAYGYRRDDRLHGDLLQGLGLGPADRLQPRLAAFGRRLGHPDAVFPAARLPS